MGGTPQESAGAPVFRAQARSISLIWRRSSRTAPQLREGNRSRAKGNSPPRSAPPRPPNARPAGSATEGGRRIDRTGSRQPKRQALRFGARQVGVSAELGASAWLAGIAGAGCSEAL